MASKERWDSLFSLSLVCRQLNHETKNLPYELNCFSVGNTAAYDMPNMKADKENLITASRISIYHLGISLRLFRQLERYPRLKTLICNFTLNPYQLESVKDFASKNGVDFIYERRGL